MYRISPLGTAVAVLAVVLPPALGAQAGSFESDDFNSCAGLASRWRAVDPVGDCGFQLVGTGTQNARLAITVPAGVGHDAFNTNRAARVVQVASDGDFELEVKFDGEPTLRYQLEGVILEQDPANWLRFDFVGNNGNINIYAGRTVNGSTQAMTNTRIASAPSGAPLWMRVRRLGNRFIQSYSRNGVQYTSAADFTHVMAVTSVGVLAGNAGSSPPAFTALCDYFFETAAPIVPEDGAASGGPFALVLSAQGGGTVSRVPEAGSYPCGTIVRLTASPNPGWQFDHWEGAASGSVNPIDVVMDRDRSVVAVFASASSPPIISNVSVVTGSTSAQVSWSTDQPASSRVDYGLSASYGSVVSNPALVSNHSLQIGGLSPGTTYHFKVTSVNQAGTSASTGDNQFSTQPGAAFTSDDFSACGGLSNRWTFVDPSHDSSVQVVGTGTPDANLRIRVPGGSNHDLTGFNGAPRVVQAANDVDFEIEVKFDTAPSGATQIEGLLIEQDFDDWLRFDFYSTSSQVRFYVGSTVAGSTATVSSKALGGQVAPLWCRVRRLGNQFTVSWSNNGNQFNQLVQFTRVLAVQAIGVYGGNAGNSSAPSFDARVDYVFDTSNRIVPEDGSSGGGPYALTTSVIGQGVVNRSPDQTSYACGTDVTLTAVPAAGWRFDHWEQGLSGSQNPSHVIVQADTIVRAVFTLDDQPPVISNVVVTPSTTTALIAWSTNEPATSRVDYGSSASYGQSNGSSQYVTQHSIQITGLTPGTLVHFRVTSTDTAGQSSSTADATFQTLSQGQLPRDDFNSQNLDRSRWTLVDGNQNGTLELKGAGTPNANLRLGVPAGSSHDPYGNADHAVRLKHAVANADFDEVLKWESALTQKYQIQGLIVEQDETNYVRCDFHFDGANLRAYAMTSKNGTPTTRGNVLMANGPWNGGPLYLRLSRVGNAWTLRTSFNGTLWSSSVGPFNFPLTVSAMGPFAANAPNGNNPAPGHVAILDWIAPYGDPITDEDSGSPVDGTPPYLYRVAESTLTSSSIQIGWFTDESATGWVEYGRTTGYELGSSPIVGPSWGPSLQLSGLAPSTTYHYRIVSRDPIFLQTATGDRIFTTHASGGGGGGVPVFDIWYGVRESASVVRQRFGQRGKPQNWVDVLGDVHDPNGSVVGLDYRLNGGPARFLNMGPDPRRLKGPGDFIIEIAWADLLPGDNQVLIKATDNQGNISEQTVIVQYINAVGPAGYAINNYGSNPDLLEVVQVVQGEFAVAGSDLHVEVPGFDRLYAIGDLTHTDYQVTMTVTVHSLTPDGFDPPSNGPAVGMGLRWIGHNGSQQPMSGFWPTGAFAWYRWTTANSRWQIRTNEYRHTVSSNQPFVFGVTYKLKAEVRTLAGNIPNYRFKWWDAQTAEPSAWMLEVAGDATDPRTGAVLILAHECDATFGPISVVSIGAGGN